MKCDELIEKIKQADEDNKRRHIPINIDIQIEDLLDAFAELKAENERLKKCEIWMKQHFYCEEVIACESAKNRRLKRALWLARAERAKAVVGEIQNAICYLKERNPGMSFFFTEGQKEVWQNVGKLCRAKAKEYK